MASRLNTKLGYVSATHRPPGSISHLTVASPHYNRDTMIYTLSLGLMACMLKYRLSLPVKVTLVVCGALTLLPVYRQFRLGRGRHPPSRSDPVLRSERNENTLVYVTPHQVLWETCPPPPAAQVWIMPEDVLPCPQDTYIRSDALALTHVDRLERSIRVMHRRRVMLRKSVVPCFG